MVNPPQQTPSWPIHAIGIKIGVHVLYQALEAREKITSIANFEVKISVECTFGSSVKNAENSVVQCTGALRS